MRTGLLAAVLFCGFFSMSQAQQGLKTDNWTWLTGDWIGEGSGKPGQGTGTFSFHIDLGRNIIVRKSHSEYPATGNSPETIHDDLMIVYHSPADNLDKAIYFDNEGHVINYSVEYSPGSIVMTSDKINDNPVFRLVYTLLEKNLVNTRFEMSRDGVNFVPYVEGKSRKVGS